jgi:hypothetical protein
MFIMHKIAPLPGNTSLQAVPVQHFILDEKAMRSSGPYCIGLVQISTEGPLPGFFEKGVATDPRG